ncbi:MAG: hypothetical protein ACYTEQ_15835 [Planctomycetota bacterium]|jgi:hypothetical protein
MDVTLEHDKDEKRATGKRGWRPVMRRGLVLLGLYFAAELVLLPAWAYLKLRWSPHGRAVFAAKGEQVAYMNVYGPRPARVVTGTLDEIRLGWQSGKPGFFLLRFRISYGKNYGDGSLRTGATNSTLTALDSNLLQALERPMVGYRDPSALFCGVLFGVLGGLIISGMLSWRWPRKTA